MRLLLLVLLSGRSEHSVTIVSPTDGVVLTDTRMTGRVHVAVCLRTRDVIGVDAWLRLRLTSGTLSVFETWFCPHVAASFEECERTSERHIDWDTPRRELNFSLHIPPNMYSVLSHFSFSTLRLQRSAQVQPQRRRATEPVGGSRR